ncbi:hypothetical protein G6O67_006793 [Ophiocordyceps sinensis]|uniref:Inositol polyphosphate-related phosphatase domain-containing protein n=1 Tax=Ophiocordyceps sinensis TaxID=72228 RepID=A0A8H4PN96_9HYPO|nr:hypothetical protein G6O67_006793 [Ophiocordyceps sinensis]
MDLSTGDGPDGSSIKPVSSLLARFENMSAAQQQEQPPPRTISPAPKPGRLRNFKPSIIVPDGPATAAPQDSDPQAPPLPSTRPTPMAKPQGLAIQTPAVTVQPPQSPPKGRANTLELGSHSPFLDPVFMASQEGHVGPPNQTKPPSRPLTPLLPLSAPKSPRPGTWNPPSPPPPRRSGEIRREKEAKQAPLPPAPRSNRPMGVRQPPSSLPEPRGNHMSSRAVISQETSPFNSPPTSPGEVVDEAPPELPRRPRPRGHSDIPSKPKLGVDGFEPPPLHPSIAMKRMEQDGTPSSPGRGVMAFPRASDHRVAIHPKPSSPEFAQQKTPTTPTVEVPPRTPRTTAQATTPKLDGHVLPSNRSASQAIARQFSVPPAGQTADIKPRDKAPERGRSENKSKTAPVTATLKSALSALVPGSDSSSTRVGVLTTYPDGANANRRPPLIKKGCHEIQTRFDARVFDVCGELVCTSGQLTRVWNLLDGELVLSLAHTEGVKATVVAFKPAPSADTEGSVLWIGTNLGEIMEVEVSTQRILHSRGGVHGRCDVIRMYRHVNELWTFDEAGTFHVWGPGVDGVPNLNSHPHQTNKLPRGHTFSMVAGDELWHATGKTIRVFAPSLDGTRPFQVLVRPLTADGAGEVTAGTEVRTHPGKVFFGHVDGKVSIFSAADYSCLAVLNVSSWKINALAGVGPHMWAAYNTGKMCVYDMSESPWIVKKDWQGHEQPVMKMKADPASSYRLDRLQVITLGADNKLKAWDGLLQDDWLEEDMKSKDVDYCDFQEIKAMIMTWNAGASTPHSLRYSDGDAGFFQELVQSSGSPDIFIFGFQELVDLEDKTATAKRFLKSSKKKEGTDQERMSHQYRDWRDFLMKTLDDYMPAGDLYHLLHSAPLVGLFTCVFVKSCLRERIRNLSAAEVKRGMGGLHGNKGAVVVRFQVDDTSLCFVNCHLAAGQSQSSSRHNDVAAILDASLFPAERDAAVRIDSFTGGGDGTMVLDHELCVLNGDLNYRIDTMSRDTVIKAVKQQNLAKLLDRDQLLIARRRNPSFRLRAFEELPITFAPTYKYDVGTDNYDTSEKKRSPAWCDRLLFRGRGRVQQLDYKRHEVRVSDHRPVTGSFRLWVKKTNPRERATAWMESQQGFEDLRLQETADEQILYLVKMCGYDEESSRKFVRERCGRSARRSPSRSRGDR